MASTRIPEFDLMRGVALFGIFVMNIFAMAYPIEAYLNPLAFDASNWGLSIEERTNLNWRLDDTVFSILYIFVYQKMFALFACLFGVSALMILKSQQTKRFRYYFARNIWLVVFGCLHLFFLFYGDILFVYGICAMVLWIFVWLPARILLTLSALLYLGSVYLLLDYQQIINDFSVQQLLELQQLWIQSAEWVVAAVEMVKEPIDEFPLAYSVCLECLEEESAIASQYYSIFTFMTFMQVFSMMLLGMGLYKSGFLPNFTEGGIYKLQHGHNKLYRFIVFWGISIGVLLTVMGLFLNYSERWSLEFSVVLGSIAVHIAAPIMLMAYLSCILLWMQSDSWCRIKQVIQAVGRMALSNYILQSVIGLLLFSGFGFGYFGEFSRLQLLLLALGVCGALSGFSVFWMRYFHYGPLEWLWRSLSKYQWTKMRKSIL